MCLAVPVRVIELLPEAMARISLDGVTKVVSIALLDDVAVGDYVILHVGFALSKLNAAEAERTLAMIRDMADGAP